MENKTEREKKQRGSEKDKRGRWVKKMKRRIQRRAGAASGQRRREEEKRGGKEGGGIHLPWVTLRQEAKTESPTPRNCSSTPSCDTISAVGFAVGTTCTYKHSNNHTRSTPFANSKKKSNVLQLTLFSTPVGGIRLQQKERQFLNRNWGKLRRILRINTGQITGDAVVFAGSERAQ